MAKKKVAEAKLEQSHKASLHDFEVIVKPVITEKSMALLQNENKATFKVSKNANKIEIKQAVERIFNVKVEDVKIMNTPDKATTRGGRYQGKIPGFKKAIVTIAGDQAISLFQE